MVPARALPRIVWAVVVSALGFAATMWLAPQLWQTETFDGGRGRRSTCATGPSLGVPCCPRHATAPTTRARMKEYFDLGRGHEHVGEPVDRDRLPGLQRRRSAAAMIVGENDPINGYASRRRLRPRLRYTAPRLTCRLRDRTAARTQAQAGGRRFTRRSPRRTSRRSSSARTRRGAPRYEPPVAEGRSRATSRHPHVAPVPRRTVAPRAATTAAAASAAACRRAAPVAPPPELPRQSRRRRSASCRRRRPRTPSVPASRPVKRRRSARRRTRRASSCSGPRSSPRRC